MNSIVESIKLNQETDEKWMLSHAVKKLLISKGKVPKVVQKQTEVIYLTHGEDDQDACNFFQEPENACLEIIKSMCLFFLLSTNMD